MLKLYVGLVVVAFWGAFAVTPSHAGQVEEARALLTVQVKEAFEDTIEYLEKKNTQDGRTAIELLFGRVQQLQAGIRTLQQNAATLSPSLGETWKPTLTAADVLVSATEVVMAKVGRGTLDLSYMKSAYDTINGELEKAYAVSKDVGRAYVETFNLVDNAEALFGDGVTRAYEAAYKYVKEENDVDGKTAMDALKVIADRLVLLSQDIKEKAEDVSPQFVELWTNRTYYDLNQLAIEAGRLTGEIGRGSVSLDNLEDYFEASEAGVEKSHAAMKTFGENFMKICDTCK